MTHEVDTLIIGAGVSGLGLANWLGEQSAVAGTARPKIAVVEREAEAGGYCRTVRKDGFVWDYSGHFFHFRYPEIEQWLRAKMVDVDISKVEKRSLIHHRGRDIDFPFQKNIHQLAKDDFIDCLVSLYFRDEVDIEGGSFRSMLYRKFGRGISERFLVPYNEKLYATDLEKLDEDAMGRFFPEADLRSIIANMRDNDDSSYNATFCYPRGGAAMFIEALERELPVGMLNLNAEVEAIDPVRREVATSAGTWTYRKLVSTMPLPSLLGLCNFEFDRNAFTSNRVLVFNLGFDRKGRSGVHWIYFPDSTERFYRVGFYDNIYDDERMSLYVEIGATNAETLDVDGERRRVLADLERLGIIDGHRLVSDHWVILDPAYVHISQASRAETERCRAELARQGIYSIGRYGRWTYCSIEDNLVEGRELAAELLR